MSTEQNTPNTPSKFGSFMAPKYNAAPAPEIEALAITFWGIARMYDYNTPAHQLKCLELFQQTVERATAGLRAELKASEAKAYSLEACVRAREGGKAPCGHWDGHCHTEDGGKTIRCYVCELAQAKAELKRQGEWFNEFQTVQDFIGLEERHIGNRPSDAIINPVKELRAELAQAKAELDRLREGAVEVRCKSCGKICSGNYRMCDAIEGRWCPECFALTPCGRGEHGEGCETGVFSEVECSCDAAIYKPEHDNFYCIHCNRGMGTAFYAVAKQNMALESSVRKFEQQLASPNPNASELAAQWVHELAAAGHNINQHEWRLKFEKGLM